MQFLSFLVPLPIPQAFLYVVVFLLLALMFFLIFWIIIRLITVPLHWFWDSIRNLMDHA